MAELRSVDPRTLQLNPNNPRSNGLQAGGAPRVAACPMMRMDGIPGLRGRPRGQSGFSIDSTVAEHAPPWADCC